MLTLEEFQVSSNNFLFFESYNLSPRIPLLPSTAMLIFLTDDHLVKAKSYSEASEEESFSNSGPTLPSEYVN